MRSSVWILVTIFCCDPAIGCSNATDNANSVPSSKVPGKTQAVKGGGAMEPPPPMVGTGQKMK